jgi:hypothetical protein
LVRHVVLLFCSYLLLCPDVAINAPRFPPSGLEIATIGELGEAGINAAGVRYILALRAEPAALLEENARLRAELAALRQEDMSHNDSNAK